MSAGALQQRGQLGRIFYGVGFVLALPVGLIVWAHGTASAVPLPALHSLPVGAALATVGVALWVWAVRELWMRGDGLPMNAYPPRHRVSSGPYALLSHPIYAGAALVSLGTAVASGSASGLWLVSPVLLLGMTALVAGYEHADLERRLGAPPAAPLVSLPRASGDAAQLHDRVNVYLLVFAPWLVAYCGVQLLGPTRDAFTLAMPIEARWPVVEWTELPYASCYLLVPLVPLLLRTQVQLRRFAARGLFATAIVTFVWLLVPAVAPSFHVLWALLAADALGALSLTWKRVAWVWAAAIVVSAVTTGMHPIADVLAAIAVFPFVRAPAAVWNALRTGAELLANSWREWRVGRVRIINHGAYAGLGGAVGYWIIATAAGPQPWWAPMAVTLSALVGAGIWAQVLESSSGLLRPFGYYGAVIGGVAGSAIAGSLGAAWPALLAATAVASPWIQAIGRLRCLVQGCCHGAPAGAVVGIVYRHPRSRVSYLADLAGRPLHPTPLYSILANFVLGTLLLRLWSVGASTTLVMGLYLIGNGLARFVEEAHRGEPQTFIVGGLHIYQWLAAISVIVGAVVTTMPGAPMPPAAVPPGTIAGAIVFGLVAGAAMGLDAPASNWRFSRLAAGDPVSPKRVSPVP